MSDECRHYNDDTNECAETGGQCDGLPLQTEDCIVYLRAALAELREVADDLKKSVITLRQFIHDLSGEDGLEDDDRVRIGLIDECALDNVLNALAAWKKAHP